LSEAGTKPHTGARGKSRRTAWAVSAIAILVTGLALILITGWMETAAFVPILPGDAVALAWLAVIAARIAVEDLARFSIRDMDTALIAAGALAFRLLVSAEGETGAHMMNALAAGGVVFAFFAGFSWIYGRIRGMDALGFGDVKLLAASALWLGVMGLAIQLLLASVAALCFAALRAKRLRRPLRRASRLPFATFLAPALVIVFAMSRNLTWMGAP
jgi:leader peptidase (prepilin peptidase) / N-methyltransferase